MNLELLVVLLVLVLLSGIIALWLKDKLGRRIDTLEINAFKPVEDIKREDKK